MNALLALLLGAVLLAFTAGVAIGMAAELAHVRGVGRDLCTPLPECADPGPIRYRDAKSFDEHVGDALEVAWRPR